MSVHPLLILPAPFPDCEVHYDDQERRDTQRLRHSLKKAFAMGSLVGRVPFLKGEVMIVRWFQVGKSNTSHPSRQSCLSISHFAYKYFLQLPKWWISQDNINCMIAGEKRFTFMHPSYKAQFEVPRLPWGGGENALKICGPLPQNHPFK